MGRFNRSPEPPVDARYTAPGLPRQLAGVSHVASWRFPTDAAATMALPRGTMNRSPSRTSIQSPPLTTLNWNQLNRRRVLGGIVTVVLRVPHRQQRRIGRGRSRSRRSYAQLVALSLSRLVGRGTLMKGDAPGPPLCASGPS